MLKSERAAYGEQIVVTLSRQLAADFGNGYSRPNLLGMIRFAELFADREIVPMLSRQLSSSHFVEILQLKDPVQRDFYAEMCRMERWSVRTLRARIGGMLSERTAPSKKPENLVNVRTRKAQARRSLSPDLVVSDGRLTIDNNVSERTGL